MNTKLLVAAAVLVAVGGGAVAVIGPGDFFLPEETTQGDGTVLATETPSTTDGATGDTEETASGSDGTPSGDGGTAAIDSGSDGDGSATVLASGEFVGVDGHDVSGRVSLVERDGDLYLQFRDYQQTSGPDVFVYVTPADEPTTSGPVNAGTKVRLDGGGDGGEATKRGTFVQKLPDSVSADDVEGIAIWCEAFGVPFGYADLTR
ncbi:DM13 domain-containing protein [Halobaculum sp. MBLA0147]|uniref:DM13 domain-containing protein n=1 Tax=Halobaculum sp. MBLA0147 TaxID=3079934 RepID=UPI0035262D13